MSNEIKENQVVSKTDLKNSESKNGFIFEYEDQKGVISRISSILAENDINIANMLVTRKNNIATMQCEIEGEMDDSVKSKLENSFDFIKTEFINIDNY